MSFIPTPSRNMRAVLVALAIQTLCLPWTSALGAQAPVPAPVTVVNGPASPVPVSGTLNVNPAPQVLSPYQVERSVSDSSTCAPQCTVSFPTVPGGKRLVITNVSAQVNSDTPTIVIESNQVSFFIPKPFPTAGYLAAPVTIYFEPNTTPTARIPVQDASQHNSLIVTFVGYLVPFQ